MATQTNLLELDTTKMGFIISMEGVNTIMPANAVPTGANTSFGSNPVFAFQSSGSSGTLFTNNTSAPAVITDLAIAQTNNSTVTC